MANDDNELEMEALSLADYWVGEAEANQVEGVSAGANMLGFLLHKVAQSAVALKRLTEANYYQGHQINELTRIIHEHSEPIDSSTTN